MHACMHGYAELAELLLLHGASPRLQNADGQNAASLAARYGREDIGVIFCGAPMIAAALKEACEDNSQKDKTIFRLHKENF